MRCITTLLCSVFWLASCLEPPPSFRRVELAEAQRLVRSEDAAVVDAVGPGIPPLPLVRGGVQWRLVPDEPPRPPELREGPVLVLGTDEALAYRAAAALARVRNQPVYVLIGASADERGTLYALDPRTEETPRGRDS